MTERCPLCGQEIRHPGSPWVRQEWRDYNSGPNTPAVAPGTSWVRREPARAPGQWDLLLPLGSALVTAVAFGGLGVLVALWRSWPAWIGGAVAVASFATAWLLLLQGQRDLLWRTEEIVGADLDGDGTVGEPEPVPQVIRLELTDRPDKAMSFLELVGISEADLLRISRLALQDRLSERNINLPRETWQRVRDELVERGLLAWRVDGAPRQGVVTTDAGRQTFERLLNLS